MRASYSYWADYLKSSRNGHDRPVANNTRVRRTGFGEDEGSIAIRFHNTDIVTFHADGRVTLAHNGWTTVTTLARMRQFSPARINTNRGNWLIPFEDDPKDPRPRASTDRTILRPFHATDPGPEPVDDGVGCRVGEIETYEVQESETIWDFSRPAPGGFRTKRDVYGDDRQVEVILRTRMHTTEIIGAGGDGYYHNWQAERDARERGNEPKRCEHCDAFAERHEAWYVKMNGPRYARGDKGEHGYRQMREHLEEHGTREAWQEAYITEFREVRENRRALKEWSERNSAPFHDGIQVLASGEVPLKAKRARVKELNRLKREKARYERGANEAAVMRAKIAQRRAEKRAVMRQIAESMAESIAVDLEMRRPEWAAVKAKHRQEVA